MKKINILGMFLKLLLALPILIFLSKTNAILEFESEGKSIKFSGQILPEGLYRIQVRPFDGQKIVAEEEFVAKTGKDGKFEMELPTEQFNGAIYNEIQIAPIYRPETTVIKQKKRSIMKRLLNEPISEEKSYKLYYGAMEPSNEEGMNRWYLHGLIINPPAFLDRWENINESFQPIQVSITAQEFCPEFDGPIVALNKHIKLAKVPWWNRPFTKGTPFRVDLTQMVMDSECEANIDQLGQIEQLQIQFGAIPNKLLGWKDQHGPASYTINYPVLSGLEQHGREFRFDYELNFFRQTKALEGIRNTANGPTELLEAWNGLMERIGTMQMGILEKNNGEIMDIETMSQGTNLKGKERQGSGKRPATDTGKMEKKSEKKKADTLEQKIIDDNRASETDELSRNMTEEEISRIINNAIERQTFEVTEQKEEVEAETISIAKSVLSMTERLCKALVRKSGLLSFAFEGICVKLLRKCELCTLKRSERDARRKEIDAEHRGIVAEISGLIGVLDKAKVLEQFFKKLWGHYVSTMAKWLRNLAKLATNNIQQHFNKLAKILYAIFGKSISEQSIDSTKESSNSEMIDSVNSIRRTKRGVRRRGGGVKNNNDDVNEDKLLPQRNCVAIRRVADLCENGHAVSVDFKLHMEAEQSMHAVVSAVDSPFNAQILWFDTKRMMSNVGTKVFSALKAMRTEPTAALTVFVFGMTMMVNFIRNTTITSVLVPVAGFTKSFHNGEFDWEVDSYKDDYNDEDEPWKYRSQIVWIDHQKNLWINSEHKETMAQVEYSKQFWNVAMVTGTIALLMLIWIGTASC